MIDLEETLFWAPRPIAEVLREALRSGSRPARCSDLAETFGLRPGRRWRVEPEGGIGSALLGLSLAWRLDRTTAFALSFDF